MSLMTLASSLPRSSLVEPLQWTGGWGEVAWKQGWVWQGQDGHEGRSTNWQDDPFIQHESRKGKGRTGRRGEQEEAGGVVVHCHASWASPTG